MNRLKLDLGEGDFGVPAGGRRIECRVLGSEDDQAPVGADEDASAVDNLCNSQAAGGEGDGEQSEGSPAGSGGVGRTEAQNTLARLELAAKQRAKGERAILAAGESGSVTGHGSMCTLSGMAKRASGSSVEMSGLPLGAGSRIVVLTGKEHFLRSGYTDQLRGMLETEQGGPVEVFRFEGESASAADVLDECRSFGLMAAHKMVVVDEADRLLNEHTRPLFERYAGQPSEMATLVLRGEKWNKGKLDKLVEKVGTIVKCDALSPERAMAWTAGRARKRHEAVMEPRASQLLVERVGPDLGRLSSEIDKLASAAAVDGTDPITITVEHVREFVGLSREEQVWSIQEVLLSGRADAAIALLHELIDISRVSEVLIRFAYVDLAKKLHGYARGLASGVSPQQLNKSLKLWGSSASAIARAAQTASPDALGKLFDEAVASDFRGKTGQGDAILALEVLSIRFAQVLRPAR